MGPFRFYMCGEYGDQFARPHFHACLFGIDFPDKQPLTQLATDSKIFRSTTLERLWQHGYTSVGAVTFQSAAYVARYVMKKITGDRATFHYTYIDDQGEIHQRTPEYNQMSRRPGLGQAWLKKYKRDVYPADHVITNGHPSQPPRYYDNQLTETELKPIKAKRKANINYKDQTPARLRAKEQVQQARASFLKRTIT